MFFMGNKIVTTNASVKGGKYTRADTFKVHTSFWVSINKQLWVEERSGPVDLLHLQRAHMALVNGAVAVHVSQY